MKKNKFLVTITELSFIKPLKKARISNFLFPLHDFCVGCPNTFKIEEIQEENSFLWINRLLDNIAYKNLETVLKDLPKNIKGIVFEDFGVISLSKKLNLKQELILYQNHFGTNYQSCNENLSFVDSIVISTDITKEETEEILKKAKKSLVYMLYGLVPAMYSRRTLLKNFTSEYQLPFQNVGVLKEQGTKKEFLAVENEFGTVLYHHKYYNGSNMKYEDNIKYYFINPLFLNLEETLECIASLEEGNTEIKENEEEGFLNQSTIYRLGEKKHE